jgi:phosphoribosylanthranilate isomerase
MKDVEPTGPTWVKICGITNQEDALQAIRAGADALGFNLWSKSKRFLSLAENAAWIADLPPGVERIAVLVNAPLYQALEVARHPAFHAVQFHGTESLPYLEEFAKSGQPFILAKRLDRDSASLENPGITDRILIDAAVPGEFGGTGTMLDTNLSVRFVQDAGNQRVILAGGLTPENVGIAIEKVKPFGVDVASGVEFRENPRRKDWEKVERFISAAKQGETTSQ